MSRKGELMKTIFTTYKGPSNTRGSRIIATDGDNKLALLYDDSLNSDENHRAACKKFCEKLHWNGKIQGGHTKNGMIWVFNDPTQLFIIK
jgi:signal-transduction protein with cAMP-binding, CBS, and nucleotidyltransferase domain